MPARLALFFVAAFALHAAAQTPVLLADGRDRNASDDLSAWANRPAVQQALAAARAYWQAQDPSYEEGLAIFGVADGAFTTPGARQQAVLYLMSAWPRCCPKTGLAVVEADRLVLNVAFAGSAQTLAAVPDLNGDGRDELVSTGAFGMGGQESAYMTLMAFGDDGLAEWGGTALFGSDCAGSGDAGSTAARVTAEPGPTYTVERFVAPDCGAWRADGAAAPLDLDPPSDVAYVELPATAAGGAGTEDGGAVRNEQGRLEPGDDTLRSGEYTDTYTVEGRQGQTLVVELRSTAFDPYLIVRLPDGQQLDNDDDEGDRTRSRVEAVLPASGTTQVVVTSYAVGETGAYDLTIRVAE